MTMAYAQFLWNCLAEITTTDDKITKQFDGQYSNESIIPVHWFGENGIVPYDGLVVLNSTSAILTDKARKDLIKISDDHGLKITVKSNFKTVNFLDITFNLSNGKFQPYRKPNDETVYYCVHQQPFQPPAFHPETITICD